MQGDSAQAAGSALPFQDRLRLETADRHDATEAAFAPFAEDPRENLGWFLAAQLIAMRALARARDGAPPAEEGDLLQQLVGALTADCESHGQAPLPALADPAPLDTLGVAYLVLGSRLGTKVLARRVTEAGLALPRAFALPSPDGAWRTFRARLGKVPPDSMQAQRILSAASRGFDIHRAAAALAWQHTKDLSR